MAGLPIEPVIPQIRTALALQGRAVLQAPPGAGKTTMVPLALLGEDWLGAGRIIMLEPRRVAARAAAERMAALLGEAVGIRVGYRIRLETRVSSATRIEVVTEGVLTRMLQHDPAMEAYGLIIFDEFHERNLHGDLGLALAMDAAANLRPELRLLVMSATLDGEGVARLLGDVPLICAAGRSFAVETRYVGGDFSESRVAGLIRMALRDNPGDVLVFLPGAGEIRRTQDLLKALGLPPDVMVTPLYGALPRAEQDRAIRPAPSGRRKVILATAIAETALTIDGVRVVVDSGLMRIPRFSPASGMARLVTVPVTRAAAVQRCGRAGRTAPGVCYRMWAQTRDSRLDEFNPPEIMQADLAPLALDLACWGVRDPVELEWLTPPPEAAFAQAQALLQRLEALTADGRITEHGRRLARLPLHPRLAHMVIKAADLGLANPACDLAALLEERDSLAGGPADIRLRLDVLRDYRKGRPVGAAEWILKQVDAAAARLRQLAGAGAADYDSSAGGLVLAFAYPDRIGICRPGARGRFLLASGGGAVLDSADALAMAELIVAAELDGKPSDARVFLGAPLELAELKAHFGAQIQTRTTVVWDPSAGRFKGLRQTIFDSLILEEQSCGIDSAALASAMLALIRAHGLELLPWTPELKRIMQRVAFAGRQGADMPDVSAAALLDGLETWLGPFIGGARTPAEIDLRSAFENLLTWKQRGLVDALAPDSFTTPAGPTVKIDYSGAEPVLSVRLQALFGLTETPRAGRQPLLIQLLSPAGRPVQVTSDLNSFWQNGYHDVRRELKGRYPKHYWPEDPLSAAPTFRAKPRKLS